MDTAHLLTAPTIVLVPQGSLGDLHPFIAIGLALKARGARVIVCTHPYFGCKVKATGLEFRALGPDRETFERDLDMPPEQIIRRMMRDHSFLLRRIVAPYMEAWIDELLPTVEEADLVMGTPLSYPAHIAAKICHKPFITGALMPAVLMSAYDPPATPEAPFVLSPESAWGHKLNQFIFTLGRLILAPGLAPISDVYRRHGLPPQESLRGVNSDGATLALFSPLLAEPQPDYPPRTEMVGFPFFDSEDGKPPVLSGTIRDFLDAGDPPLVFSLGSVAIYNGERYYRNAAEAARQLGERAILLAGCESPLLNEDFGPDILVVPYAPHSLLFPRARVIIHHGGIGSTAQALRAGRPQLVTPVFGDQYDNGRRVNLLGAGQVLNFKDFTVRKAIAALRPLMASSETEAVCRTIAPIIAAEDGSGRAADLLLQTVRQRAWSDPLRSVAGYRS